MIEVENLFKNYGNIEAVRDVSFSVGRGQVLGFLGPNGAGKTTIMKILTGYHFPTRGQAKIDGVSVEEEPWETKKRIGYLPEGNPLYGDLSPEEYLSFIASARLIPKGERKKAVDAAIAACGLGEHRSRRIGSLSKGYRQRTALAQAIIHDPDILILDEPTSGLDPNQIIEIRSLIREMGKSKTVILSTHIMQEVEALCTRVLILNEGQIAAQGTPAEIAGTIKGGSLGAWELYLKGAKAGELPERLATLGKLEDDVTAGGINIEGLGAAGIGFGCISVSDVAAETLDQGVVRLCFALTTRQDENRNEGNDSAGIFRGSGGTNCSLEGELIFDWAVRQGYKITGMTRKNLSLEDIFVRLTNEEARNE